MMVFWNNIEIQTEVSEILKHVLKSRKFYILLNMQSIILCFSKMVRSELKGK